MTDEYGLPSHPGEPQGGPQYSQQPPPGSNLVWGILTTIFCCLPFGIVSIVKASKVNSLWATGAQEQARAAAADARKWAIIAAVTGVALSVLWGILLVAGVITLGTTANLEY